MEDRDDSFPESIEAPTREDVDRIAKLLLKAKRTIQSELGQGLTDTRQDLRLVQTFLDTRIEKATEGTMPLSLGLLLADLLVNENSDFDWWIAVSGKSREAVARFKHTDLLFHPEDFLAKRLATSERIDVAALYQDLKKSLAELSKQAQ